ncbi:hypothetical protein C8T65DRAFT_575529 [Cerioporus squamosus]|nr:hypothetical protein C8T65DRAFT_575529 [Cerioporus squamosus]
MGSAQSYIPLATVVVAGAAAYGYAQLNKPAPVSQGPSTSTASSSSSKKQKQKKKAGASAGAGSGASTKEDVPAEPSVVAFPPVVPGDFEAASAAPSDPADRPAAAGKPKKKKKAKKASPVPIDAQSDSSATAPESSAARKPKKSATPRPAALDDDGWTRVETKKKGERETAKAGAPAGEGRPQLEVSTSDAGITTSATGNSSPVTERTEDESALADNRRTLAERLLPKPRKTGVEDLLEEPDYPQLARVMRIKPRADEQPAAGFSWADYEDVDSSRGTADDADGEDDGGWGVVKSRGRPKANKTPSQQTPTTQKAPETLTKKQRQHAARREAEKAAKAEAEAQRLAALAKHKRELERERMAEQAKTSKKTTGGGMSAYVDENGKLVWQ